MEIQLITKKEESNKESEQTNDLVSTKNYNINEINENEETQGKHLEVVVKDKISKKTI